MKTTTVIVYCATLLATAAVAHADGALDPAFGTGGRSTIPFDVGGAHTDQAFGSVLQPDGKLVIVGAATNAAANYDFAITRVLADGTRDATFGTNGRTTVAFDLPLCGKCDMAYNDIANAVTLQPDGKIVVLGTADGGYSDTGGASGANSSMVLARLMPNGTLDASFGSNGKYVIAFGGTSPPDLTGDAIVINNGAIIAVGSYFNVPASLIAYTHPVYVVVHANNTYDLGTFWFSANSPGVQIDAHPTSVSIDASGRMVMSGYYIDNTTNGYDCFVTRLSANAPLYDVDTSFGTSGLFRFGMKIAGSSFNNHCWSHAIQPDGKIVVVGQADTGPSEIQATTARILPNGEGLDTSFGGQFGLFSNVFEDSGAGATNVARAVKLQSDGKIVVAGYGSVSDPTRAPYDFGVLRLNKDGSPDTTFVGNTPGSDPNGSTVMIGFEGFSRAGTGNGDTDQGFALSIDSADRLYVAGTMQYEGTDTDMAVARLQSDKIFVNGFESPH